MEFQYFLYLCLAFISMICTLTTAATSEHYFPSAIRIKREHSGITGPVHTFVKTDKHANFKWGVRHHVGHHYAGRRR